jgi:hypothetical protein
VSPAAYQEADGKKLCSLKPVAANALCRYGIAALLVTLPSLLLWKSHGRPAAESLEQGQSAALQQEECTAPKTGIDSSSTGGLRLAPSTIERIGSNNISQSEVG